MFAHALPLAKESRIVKWNSLTGAIAMSQNALTPSRPWWPLPSGSKKEGPTGSSMTASSAHRVSHSSFCLRETRS